MRNQETAFNGAPLSWRKSSYSGGAGGNCAEVALLPKAMVLRDSKYPDSTTLRFSHDEWTTFQKALRNDGL